MWALDVDSFTGCSPGLPFFGVIDDIVFSLFGGWESTGAWGRRHWQDSDEGGHWHGSSSIVVVVVQGGELLDDIGVVVHGHYVKAIFIDLVDFGEGWWCVAGERCSVNPVCECMMSEHTVWQTKETEVQSIDSVTCIL